LEFRSSRKWKGKHIEGFSKTTGDQLIEKISNQPISYDWGSTHLIPDLVGLDETETPIAEMWFGTHPISTAKLANGNLLSKFTQLGFMVKFLGAAKPLSIQAHPTETQAISGFQKENKQGIELEHSSRIFKDENHKPEILIAVSPFRVLSGFRPIEKINQDLAKFAAKDALFENWRRSAKTLSEHFDFVFQQLDSETLQALKRNSELVRFLADYHPEDKGLAIAFLLNEIFLAPGEAVFLPAGNLHAYLQGFGVEVMATSDNVVRGGLTTKHVDVEKLREITVFESINPKLGPNELQRGLDEYEVEVDDFRVYRVEPNGQRIIADIELPGEGILVCVGGEVTVSNSLDERQSISKGEACYISNDARLVSFAGSGTAFLATGS
jgi:mannose-6-phosphate isomerase